jgi:hypothetical protein
MATRDERDVPVWKALRIDARVDGPAHGCVRARAEPRQVRKGELRAVGPKRRDDGVGAGAVDHLAGRIRQQDQAVGTVVVEQDQAIPAGEAHRGDTAVRIDERASVGRGVEHDAVHGSVERQRGSARARAAGIGTANDGARHRGTRTRAEEPGLAKLKVERVRGHVYAMAKTGTNDPSSDPEFTTVPTTSTAVSAGRVAKAWNSRRKETMQSVEPRGIEPRSARRPACLRSRA